MARMTARERALAALTHREPDRIPIDLGSHGFDTGVLPAHDDEVG